MQVRDLCIKAGLTEDEICDAMDYITQHGLQEMMDAVCAGIQPLTMQESSEFGTIPSGLYALSEQQIDEEIQRLEQLQANSALNVHDCELANRLEQIVLDISKLEQLDIDNVARISKEEMEQGFDAYKRSFEVFLDRLMGFLQTYTAFKSKMTSFQPGLTQQLEGQVKQIRQVVEDATSNSICPETRQSLQCVYGEAFRVHRQLVAFRTYELQLTQIINATTFRQQFDQTSTLVYNENPTQGEIDNEVQILQELQEENIRLNAEINSSLQNQFDEPTAEVIEAVLNAINEDLGKIQGNLARIFEFLQQTVQKVNRIVGRISTEHEVMESCNEVCGKQLQQLQKTKQIVQDIISNLLHSQTEISKLRESPITLLGIDKVLEPFSTQPIAIVAHVNDLEEECRPAERLYGYEEAALNKQNALLHEKGKVLEMFQGIELDDSIARIDKEVKEAEFKMRQIMQ